MPKIEAVITECVDVNCAVPLARLVTSVDLLHMVEHSP